jgi:hypothetical protein
VDSCSNPSISTLVASNSVHISARVTFQVRIQSRHLPDEYLSVFPLNFCCISFHGIHILVTDHRIMKLNTNPGQGPTRFYAIWPLASSKIALKASHGLFCLFQLHSLPFWSSIH